MKTKTRAQPRQAAWDIDLWVGGSDAIDPRDGLAPPEDFDRVSVALYLASGRDAGVGVRCGQMVVTYTRTAPTLDQALASALADFHQAGLRLEILRVEIEPVPPAPRRKQRRAS